MASDIVFKTKAFGGFNKQEVMDFVNRILADKSELEKRIAEINAKYAKTNAELSECKGVIEEANNLKAELVEIKDKLASLEAENSTLLSDKEAAVAELNSKNADFDEVNLKLNDKTEELERVNSLLNDKISENEAIGIKLSNTLDENESLRQNLSENALTEETKNELEFLRSEVKRLKLEAEKSRDLERQVGAAMLDARVHSEELVEDAKAKANEVTKSVYSAIGDTAVKIDELSGGIGEIARSFTKSVEEVELRIKALTGDMSKTAQLLISESGVIAEQIENTENDEENKDVEYDFSSFNNTSDIEINPDDYNLN